MVTDRRVIFSPLHVCRRHLNFTRNGDPKAVGKHTITDVVWNGVFKDTSYLFDGLS